MEREHTSASMLMGMFATTPGSVLSSGDLGEDSVGGDVAMLAAYSGQNDFRLSGRSSGEDGKVWNGVLRPFPHL